MKEIPSINDGPHSVMGRFFPWLFSRRIMRRVLMGVAGLITFVAVLYAGENWRGKRVWENCKLEMTAQGEELDWSAFVPPPVPDEQNIFKAPKISDWFGDNRGIIDLPLEKRLTNDFARRLFNTNSTTEITTKPGAVGYLEWSDQFQDDFDTLSGALKRPYARMPADYSQPLSITLPNVAALYAVVKTLVQRAKCHLMLGQTEQAWQELTLLHDLRRMVEAQGRFITTEGDWVRRELARHSLQVIAKGLELHAWQEPQLHILQDQLRDSDFIALHVQALKCGRALIVGSLENGDFFKAQFTTGGDGIWTRFKKHPELLIFTLAPRGLTYEGAAGKARQFRTMINALTPTNGIIRPGDVSKACAWWKRAQEGLPLLLRTQTLVNEAQVACALERHRLAHGEYSEALDTLVPQFMEKLPRDILNGEPLSYRRTEDGSFLLYSVGWNETNDGGKIILANGDLRNLTMGDWVWKNSLRPE